jgi:hypothetical protein
MLLSAYILPLVPRVDWAKAVAPTDALRTVDAPAALDVSQYGQRDRELAYRDLIVAAAVAQVALRTTDIWDFRAPRPIMPFPAAGQLASNPADYPSVLGFPGRVDHVDNQSIPLDAASVDKQLYGRDLMLYQSLFRAAAALVDNPLPSNVGPDLGASDVWALAYGVNRQLDVGYSLPLAPSLFKTQDQYLAWRDNVLAAYVAATVQNISNIYAIASRLLVQVAGVDAAEADVYVLQGDDGRFRTWAAQPLVPGKLSLVYDRQEQTLSWTGENVSSAPGPAPTATTFTAAFASTVTVLGDVPGYLDAEYYRQKSSRLNVRPWHDRVIAVGARPNDFVTGGSLYQVDSVLLPVAGSATFAVPAVVPSGCVRVGLVVEPSREIDVSGFQNLEGAADGTAVTFVSAGTHSWQFSLPAGRLFFSLSYRDKTFQTLSFNVQCTANATTVFDGALVYNKAPGAPATSQLVELDTVGGPVLFTVSWDGAGGQFTLDKISFFTQAPSGQQVEYTVQADLSGNSSYPLTLAGVPGRVDAVILDICVDAELAGPTLTVTWSGGSQICLYIFAYDIRVFDTAEILPGASAYDPYKQTLVGLALESVQRSAAAAQTTPPTDYRTLDADTGQYLWDAAANGRWLNAVAQVETRLALAFQRAGPGDVGRLALVPAGLQLDQGVRVLATNPASTPALRTLQAWMIDFGAVVAGPDFLPLPDGGCASQGTAPLRADFSAVPSSFGYFANEPTLVDLAATSHYPDAPDGTQPLAWTIANSGPAGGTLSQTVDFIVTAINLAIGQSYTVTVTVATTPLIGGSPVESTVAFSFTAVAPTQQAAGPTLTAAVGYQVEIRRATIA